MTAPKQPSLTREQLDELMKAEWRDESVVVDLDTYYALIAQARRALELEEKYDALVVATGLAERARARREGRDID